MRMVVVVAVEISVNMSGRPSSSLALALVLLVVVFLSLELFSSALALSCMVYVRPTTTIETNTNCSDVPCSWNRALSWCAHNQSDSSVWWFLLESGMYSFEKDKPPSPMQIPPGVNHVRIESSSLVSPAVWSGVDAWMNISSPDAAAAGVHVDVVGISFTKNSALTVKNANIQVEKCTFSESIGNRALSIETSGDVMLENAVFSGNLVGGGGEIQGNPQSVTIQGCRFVNNSIENGSGGGLAVNGGSGEVWVINSTFVNNTAYGSGSGSSECRGFQDGCGGGGIAAYTTGVITVQNSSFVRNTARNLTSSGGSAGGGGMWMYGKSVQVVRSNFVGNTAMRNGGVNSGSNGGGGGWIYASNGAVVIEDVYGRNNSAVENGIGNYGANNQNSGSGGGCLWIYSMNDRRISVYGGIFVGNQAIRNGMGQSYLESGDGNGGWNNGGGAIWMWTQNAGGDIEVVSGLYVWNRAIENGQGGSNTVNGNGNGGSFNGGGAVWMYSTSFATVSNCIMTNNIASYNGQGGSNNGNGNGGKFNGGGAVWMYPTTSATVSNCTMTNNIASNNGQGGSRNQFGNGNGGSQNGGGAVLMGSFSSSSSYAMVSNCTMTNNTASYNGQGGSRNQFGNGGYNNGGGAVWMLSSSATVSNSTMTNNIASNNGQGGSNNRNDGNGGSQNGGGAVWMNSYSSSATVSNCIMTSNIASGNGQGGSNNGDNGDGGWYNGGGAFNMYSSDSAIVSYCTFVYNIASRNGVGGSNNTIGNGNGGSYNGGGAVWMYPSTSATLLHSTMTSNIANENGHGGSNNKNGTGNGGSWNGGGAVWMCPDSSSARVSNCSMTINIARSNGQGGSNNKNGNGNGGSQNGGGAMWIYPDTSVTLSLCTMTSNIATENGLGGSNNTYGNGNGGSQNGGGALWIYSSFSSTSLSHSTITYNIASQNGQGGSKNQNGNGNGGSQNGGGAVWMYAFSFATVLHCRMASNIAYENGIGGSKNSDNGNGGSQNGGGAVWMYSSTSSTVSYSSMMLNVASGNGKGGLKNTENGNGGLYNGGGAVWTYSSSSVTVLHCTITRNSASGNGEGGSNNANNGIGSGNGGSYNGGGGVFIYFKSISTIDVSFSRGLVCHCTITRNIACFNGQGGSNNAKNGNGNGNGGSYNGGGGVWISSESSSTVTHCLISNNSAIRNGQGGIQNGDNGNGGSYNGGGGVWMNSISSTVSVSNCTLANNSASGNGFGGSHNYENGNGGSFNGGGATWMLSINSSVMVSHCTFMNNLANENGQGGSDNYVDGNGGSQNGGGAVWMEFLSSIISQCTMKNNSAYANGNGGLLNGIQSIGGNSNGGGALFGRSLDVSWHSHSRDNMFFSNSASRNGMGGTGYTSSVFASGGSLCGGGAALLIGTSLSYSHFFNNSDSYSGIVSSTESIGSDGSNNGGGAVLAQNAHISNCSFQHNSVTSRPLSSAGNGGAVRLVSGSKIESSTISDNLASFRGGGVASGSGKNVIISSVFRENSATFDGGAVVVDDTDVHLSATFSKFVGNRALAARGGALAVVAYLSSIATHNCTFASNHAVNQGGAAAVIVEGGIYKSEHDIFFSNRADTFGGVLYSGSGKHHTSNNNTNVSPAFVSVYDAQFFNNSAGFGGVIMTDDRGTASISSSHARNNRATSISGGFAHLTVRSQLKIISTVMAGNSAAVSAGSIYQEHFSILVMQTVLLLQSSATYAGGMRCIDDSHAFISFRSALVHNRATEKSAGALYTAGNASIVIRDTYFFNNSAASYGGALILLDSSRVILSYSYFIDNVAKSSGGGAFSLSSSSTLKLFDSACISNLALGGAGGCGIVRDSASLQSHASNFTNNNAEEGDGGAISFGSSKVPRIVSSQFRKNQAWRGGAITFNSSAIWSSYSSTAYLWIRNCAFVGNRALSVPQQRLQNTDVGLLAPGGGGAIFFNLRSNDSLWNAYQAWQHWTRFNTFSGNIAVYGSHVSSVGIFPFISYLPNQYSSYCHEMSTFQRIRHVSHQLYSISMPGIPISLQVGVCDAFGKKILTLAGGSILYSLFNNTPSSSQLSPKSIVRTSSNGTGEVFTHLPVGKKSWYRLETQLSSWFPTLSLIWKSSSCVPFYGFLTDHGCVLCASSQFSIDISLYPCIDCQKLSPGSSCLSVEFPHLHIPRTSWLNFSLSNPESAQVTVVQIDSNYWPALIYTQSTPSTVVSVACPFDYCSRSNSLFVTGVDSSHMIVTTSNSSFMCKPNSHRDPSSPLCGRCMKGYAEWNFVCEDCVQGIDTIAVLLFLLERAMWSLIQLILAQGSEREESASILVFFTQSLFMFTFPQDVIKQLENMVSFRAFFRHHSQCIFDISIPASLAVSTIMPILNLIFIWLFFGLHRSLAYCLLRCRIKKKKLKKLESFVAHRHDRFDASFHDQKLDPSNSCWVSFINWFVDVSTISPYLRATALGILNMFGPMIFSIYLVWNCTSVPMGSTVVDVVFFAPAFECYTSEYYHWQGFYITILILLVALVVWILYISFRYRNRLLSLPRAKSLSGVETGTNSSRFTREYSEYSVSLPHPSSSQVDRSELILPFDSNFHPTESTVQGRSQTLSDLSFIDELARIWIGPFRTERFWFIGVDFLVRIVFITLFTLLLKFLDVIGTPIRFALSVAALLWFGSVLFVKPYSNPWTYRFVLFGISGFIVVGLSTSSMILPIYIVWSVILLGRVVAKVWMFLRVSLTIVKEKRQQRRISRLSMKLLQPAEMNSSRNSVSG